MLTLLFLDTILSLSFEICFPTERIIFSYFSGNFTIHAGANHRKIRMISISIVNTIGQPKNTNPLASGNLAMSDIIPYDTPRENKKESGIIMLYKRRKRWI